MHKFLSVNMKEVIVTVAVVLRRNDGKRHSVSIEKKRFVCIISIGRSVGKHRISKAVRPFGRGVIFWEGIKPVGREFFSSGQYREELLFEAFKAYVLSLPGLGLTVGVNDIFGRYAERLIPLIRHAAEVRIRTVKNLDEFCERCILSAGTCPFVSPSQSVIDGCDILFDPYGAETDADTVFGKGGQTADGSLIKLPEWCSEITSLGVDPVELAALMSLESDEFTPEKCLAFCVLGV